MQRAAALPVIVSIFRCESLHAETADVELALGVDDLLRKPRGFGDLLSLQLVYEEPESARTTCGHVS